MSDSEKPKSWKERRQSIKYKWLTPFVFPEWLCERLSYFLGEWAFLDILGHASRLAILVALISYIMGGESRQKAKHYQAWQVINLAQGKSGSGGRMEALQDLNKDRVSLDGIDISKAFLRRINLEDAFLGNANLTEAILMFANLAEAHLREANLFRANLMEADLTGADLADANLTEAKFLNTNLAEANLFGANLTGIFEWRSIESIENANIHDVKNAPDGFIEWAKEHGAISVFPLLEEEHLERKERIKKKREKQ